MRRLTHALIALVLLETLGVVSYTLYHVAEAATSVPWWDQWIFVREFESYQRGRSLWPILWSPYWGHRLVVPRLLFFADALWGSLGSLTWVTLLVQFAHIGLLVGLAWAIFGRNSRACFVLAATVVVSQLLSPFQVINFLWSMQTMFPLVYLAATVSILCLAMNRPVLSVAAGLICSYTMPNGLFIWPVLVGLAIFWGLPRSRIGVLAGLGIVVITTYFLQYERGPAMGMGVAGMLRDPLHGLMLVGFLLAGPLDLISRRIGPIAVIVALILLGFLWSRSLTCSRRHAGALIAIIIFTVLSAASMVAARLDRRWLNGEFVLASRYYTVSGVFWAAVALFVLYTCWQQRCRPWFLAFFGILFIGVMFGRVQRQLIWAEDWSDFFRGVDATGLALLLDVPDEQFLSVLWPGKPDRDEWTRFLRDRHLTLFADPRSTWPGKQITEFRSTEAGRCIGAIESSTDVSGARRIWGWAWDIQSHTWPRHILLTDPSGRIVGMGRGGLRHGYLPGFTLDPMPGPNSHPQFRHSEWLGYARGTSDPVSVYGVIGAGGEVCRVN